MKVVEIWKSGMETKVGDQMATCFQIEFTKENQNVVLVTQDQCIFQAHDDRRILWDEKTTKDIRPKGPGASITVSAFL